MYDALRHCTTFGEVQGHFQVHKLGEICKKKLIYKHLIKCNNVLVNLCLVYIIQTLGKKRLFSSD